MPLAVASVRAARLSFAYADAAPVLDRVEFHLSPGWWGLVGDNGAGKSTLLRLIAGRLAAGEGEVRVEPEGALVVVCEQEVEVVPDGAWALAEDWSGAAQRRRARLGLGEGTEQLERWTTLSPGQRKRWQIAAALHAEPDVLLCDEPTNHLDGDGRRELVRELRGFRGVGVVVAHDRALLEALTAGTVRVRAGKVDVQEGAYGKAREAWDADDAARMAARAELRDAARAAEARLADARRERASAERSTTRSGRMRKSSASDARTLGAANKAAWAEKRAGRSVTVARGEAERAARQLAEAGADGSAWVPKAFGRSLRLEDARAPRPVVANVEVAELRAGPHVCARDVKLVVRRDDRVWVRGPNGAGKSTLLAAVVAAAGLPEERVLWLPQELTSAEGRRLVEEARRMGEAERGRTMSVVAALGVDPDRLLASAQPSPGEARKLALASALGRAAWLLVLDEPENHLDLASIERVEAALEAYGGAVVVVTHDEAMGRRIGRRVWRVEGVGGGVVE